MAEIKGPRVSFEGLKGAEKAAVVLLALGEEQATGLMSRLDETELAQVTRAMATFGKLPPELVREAARALEDLVLKGAAISGGALSTERLLSRFLPPERVSEIMTEIRGPAGRTTWEKLSNVNEQMLANYLKAEYPQTVAVVLSRLRPDHAAKVLPLLPQKLLLDVVARMINLGTVQREVLGEVENTLHQELMASLGGARVADPHAQMAEIFNRTDPNTLDSIFSGLENEMPEQIQDIKDKMFTFEDLARVDPSALLAVIRQVDGKALAVALKGTTEEMRNVFIGALSPRAAGILQEEIALLGPIRLRDAQEAQATIVQTARDMAARGEIMLPRGSGDDDLIV